MKGLSLTQPAVERVEVPAPVEVDTICCEGGCGKEVPNDDDHCLDWYDTGDGGLCPDCQGTDRDYRERWGKVK